MLFELLVDELKRHTHKVRLKHFATVMLISSCSGLRIPGERLFAGNDVARLTVYVM